MWQLRLRKLHKKQKKRIHWNSKCKKINVIKPAFCQALSRMAYEEFKHIFRTNHWTNFYSHATLDVQVCLTFCHFSLNFDLILSTEHLLLWNQSLLLIYYACIRLSALTMNTFKILTGLCSFSCPHIQWNNFT